MEARGESYILRLAGFAVVLMLMAAFTLSCGELDDVVDITISGTVIHNSTSAGLFDISIKLSGTMTGDARTDSQGNYSFGSLTPGRYTVEAISNDYDFEPEKYIVITDQSEPNVDFTGTPK